MNSTTGDNRIPLSRILLISALLQAAGFAIFYAAEPLRKSILTADDTPRDVRAVDREATARLRNVEEQRQQQREKTALKREDAETMARNVEKEKTATMSAKLEDMQKVRDELTQAEAALLQDLAARTPQDVGNYFYERIVPLCTQLVENARNQTAQADLAAAPVVQAASESLLQRVQRERENLLLPDVFADVRELHRKVHAAQEQYIQQLDQAQTAYPADLDRIRRENHVEYLVNLLRDQLAGMLGEMNAFPVATMNELPENFATPQTVPVENKIPPDERSLADVHASAQALFDEIQQRFKNARAAHLALEQHTSMTGAYAALNMPTPTPAYRPDDGRDTPRTMGELNRLTDQMSQAARDVGQLWQQAQNMGAAGRAMAGRDAAASNTGGAPGANPPAAGRGQGHGQGRGGPGTSAANAAAGLAGRFADMTPFMYAGGGSGERGFGSKNAGGGDLTVSSIRSGYAETGAGTPGAKGPPLLSEAKVIKEALPGRKFSRTSPRTGWLYLDTWYVIGPWENNSRVGFEQPWPPESLVDLDATYEGKKGRKLAWQFHQSDNIRIKPPAEEESSTYYAYTEVHFDEEMEMLVAVASDDAAKVWLNDQVIWRDDGIGPWRLDEGFRKVIFKKGFNTLLVRIENGPITCTFSILLCPPEVLI